AAGKLRQVNARVENARYDQRRELGFCLNEARWARGNYAIFLTAARTHCTAFPQRAWSDDSRKSFHKSQQTKLPERVSTAEDRKGLWKRSGKVRRFSQMRPLVKS